MADFARQSAMPGFSTDLLGPYPFDAYRVVVDPGRSGDPAEAPGLAVFGANHIDWIQGLERLVAHELPWDLPHRAQWYLRRTRSPGVPASRRPRSSEASGTSGMRSDPAPD